MTPGALYSMIQHENTGTLQKGEQQVPESQGGNQKVTKNPGVHVRPEENGFCRARSTQQHPPVINILPVVRNSELRAERTRVMARKG